MGLEIFVGRLAQAHRDDPEEAEFFADQYAELNAALKRAGQPPHHEPLDYSETDVFEEQMWGYSGLHAVRRLAAHIASTGALPAPASSETATDDPALRKRYAAMDVGGQPSGGGSLLQRLFGRKTASPREQFDHLINHSDAEGFYIPRDLDRVIVDEDVDGGLIGSSVRLLAECRILAEALELPAGLGADDEEVIDAAETPSTNGPLWKQYGVETFCLLRLIRAAELSVKHRAVVSFG